MPGRALAPIASKGPTHLVCLVAVVRMSAQPTYAANDEHDDYKAVECHGSLGPFGGLGIKKNQNLLHDMYGVVEALALGSVLAFIAQHGHALQI